jgi:lactoylglutathione lyase
MQATGMSFHEPPAAYVTGLFETHLNVAHLERSMEFYGSVLGLEPGTVDRARRLAIYWIGGRGKAMLGLWEKPPEKIVVQHFAFEVRLDDLDRVMEAAREQRIELRDFFDQPADVPSVFGWMPAASIYFNDPDGHLLEFIAMLPDEPRPEVGIVTLDEWMHSSQSPQQP